MATYLGPGGAVILAVGYHILPSRELMRLPYLAFVKSNASAG